MALVFAVPVCVRSSNQRRKAAGVAKKRRFIRSSPARNKAR
jgi:hypothetical protein